MRPEPAPAVDTTDLYAQIEAKATEYVKLGPAHVHEIAASVIADYWTVLHQNSKQPAKISEGFAAEDICRDVEKRTEWLNKRVSAAVAKLLRRRPGKHQLHTVELHFDPPDNKDIEQPELLLDLA